MIELEALLAPTAEAPPCGVDLAHDAAFVELEQLAQGKPERAVGKTVVAAEPPPWREVGAKAVALLARTKDLRIAMLLLRAELHLHGMQGLLGGLQLLHGLVDRCWAELHPRLDADDDDDPTMRLNALAPLAGLPNAGCLVVRELRDQVLLRSREHGPTTVRDVETALGKLAPRPGTQPPALAQIEAAFAHAGAGGMAALPPVAATLAALHALGELLDARLGAARTPDLKPLANTLHTLTLLQPAAPAAAHQEPSMQADAAILPPIAEATGASAATPAAASGSIHCKEDALALLTRIIDYLERHEPSNPAPLLLRRGRRFMTMGFVDIVKEIAPDSIAKLDLITGPRDAS